jgi:hypothetical protein
VAQATVSAPPVVGVDPVGAPVVDVAGPMVVEGCRTGLTAVGGVDAQAVSRVATTRAATIRVVARMGDVGPADVARRPGGLRRVRTMGRA